mmetsp:Transcript_19689/g.66188  ORF Transcript_19689/g.66188 Transcript_19689/m.66188 type:complete len:252 (+) Transcript_19689:616-1371(+)
MVLTCVARRGPQRPIAPVGFVASRLKNCLSIFGSWYCTSTTSPSTAATKQELSSWQWMEERAPGGQHMRRHSMCSFRNTMLRVYLVGWCGSQCTKRSYSSRRGNHFASSWRTAATSWSEWCRPPTLACRKPRREERLCAWGMSVPLRLKAALPWVTKGESAAVIRGAMCSSNFADSKLETTVTTNAASPHRGWHTRTSLTPASMSWSSKAMRCTTRSKGSTWSSSLASKDRMCTTSPVPSEHSLRCVAGWR